MSGEPKPCPFCGAKVGPLNAYSGRLYCGPCGADAPVSTWNTRHGAGDAEDAARWRAFKNGSGQPFGTDYVIRQFSRTFGEEEPVSWIDFERAMDERVAARAGERGVA